MRAGINIAIVGATGLVGSTLLNLLDERQFKINKIFLVASHHSSGNTIEFKGQAHWVSNLAEFDFSDAQIAFFCVSNDIAKEYAPKAASHGCVVIDKSSYFRMDNEVPLIVPEVNSDTLKNYTQKNIIASPNCSTIPLVMALKPLYDAVGLVRVNVATYQSVSGSGKAAITELIEQTSQLLNGIPVKPEVYSDQIAFNVIPHIDDFLENGYTKEEMKVVWETQKILGSTEFTINPTAVRVPVFYGHSAAVHVETKQKISSETFVHLLKKMQGISIQPHSYGYATPVSDAAGKDAVFVGRIRDDISCERGINFWVVSDNLRKGAALNAIQIAEQLVQYHL